MTPLLQVRGLTKVFGGLRAVDDVSFSVREHEVMGLIGPNGSGKTTMLNLISGALTPTAGDIFLGDRMISGRPARDIARAGVARTFQLVRVLPGLSVVENVMAGAVFGHRRLWGREARKMAERLLERVGLAYATGLPASALTYIDEKRVELARALAGDPTLLLLDEWLAGLNPTASLVYNPAPPLITIITRGTHDGEPRSQAYSEDGTRWTFGGTAFSNRVRFFAEGHDAGEEGAKPQSVSAAATSYTYRF